MRFKEKVAYVQFDDGSRKMFFDGDEEQAEGITYAVYEEHDDDFVDLLRTLVKNEAEETIQEQIDWILNH